MIALVALLVLTPAVDDGESMRLGSYADEGGRVQWYHQEEFLGYTENGKVLQVEADTGHAQFRALGPDDQHWLAMASPIGKNVGVAQRDAEVAHFWPEPSQMPTFQSDDPLPQHYQLGLIGCLGILAPLAMCYRHQRQAL